jgi:SsrA-binding protein
MATKPTTGEKLIASNKKALHDYFVLQKVEAGVALTGTEVKSLREGKANLKDSYVIFRKGEAWLLGTHISPYAQREIEKLEVQVVEKGLTVVPLRLYFRGPKVKAEIAVVRGKKLYDKRETEKRREADREAAAAIKSGR